MSIRLYRVRDKSGMPVDYPSVTSVLSLFYSQLYPTNTVNEQFLTHRAAVGTATHQLIEKAICGYLPTDEDKELLGGEPYRYFLQAVPVVKKLKIVEKEKIILSKFMMVAGRFDMLVKSRHGMEVWDLKTSLKPKREYQLQGYFMQVAAYAAALEEMRGIQIDRAVLLMTYPNKSENVAIDRSDIKGHIKQFLEYRARFRQLHGY